MAGWVVRGLAAICAATISMSALAQPVPSWATVPDVPPLPKPERNGFVHNSGVRLYYAVFNRHGGSPVILLHGGFASSDSWGYEVPLLARSHEVIVWTIAAKGGAVYRKRRSAIG